MSETAPTGAEAAAAALRESVAQNKRQQEVVEESRLLMLSLIRSEMKEAVQDAVRQGILASMTDEAAERFWNKGFEVAQLQARKRLRDGAGDLVIGALKGLFKWGSMAVVLLAFAYYVGGWTLLKAVGAGIFPKN
jgi:hypothetical protein